MMASSLSEGKSKKVKGKSKSKKFDLFLLFNFYFIRQAASFSL